MKVFDAAKEATSVLTRDVVASEALVLEEGESAGYDPLIDRVANARFVLLGEASHGTHEFYSERALITKRLIEERGFGAVAVEADFPDAYRVNRYVMGEGGDTSAEEALSGFGRFPAWMWRNAAVIEFVGWLRGHNDSMPSRDQKCGFYGLDLYSLHTSIAAVLSYLERVDPDAAARAQARYSCFDLFDSDTQAYGYATAFGLAKSCETEVVSQLTDLHKSASKLVRRDGRAAAEDYFFAEQNARLVRNAEHYYRTMFLNDVSSWNLRDRHMVESLTALNRHLSTPNRPARVVVWAHNSHLGDARATEMGRRGEWNVGQLVRQLYPGQAISVGFTTNSGTVTAASSWGGEAERKIVRPALPESFEKLFHETLIERFLLLFVKGSHATAALHPEQLERAIGVIYRPETERQSHYFYADMARQFDAVIHIDETSAVEPLEKLSNWVAGEAPETFPTGI